MLKNVMLGCLSLVLCGCTFKTYRYYDHVGVRGMGLNYRTDEEVEEWKNKDAIEAFEKRLVQLGVMTKKKIENVHNAINKDI